MVVVDVVVDVVDVVDVVVPFQAGEGTTHSWQMSVCVSSASTSQSPTPSLNFRNLFGVAKQPCVWIGFSITSALVSGSPRYAAPSSQLSAVATGQ